MSVGLARPAVHIASGLWRHGSESLNAGIKLRLAGQNWCCSVASRTQFAHSISRRGLKHTRRTATSTVMVLTESTAFGIGTKAPPFKLPEPLTGKTRSLEEISQGAKAILVMFICNHCPFVKLLKEGMVDLAKDYQPKGVAVVAISSNSVKTHPQDGPTEMAKDAAAFGYTFPYLYDETQEVANAYRALCTPEFMVFDSNMELQYHGQFDSARPSRDVPVTGEDLRAALDDILGGRPVGKPIKPSVGCNIKWHP